MAHLSLKDNVKVSLKNKRIVFNTQTSKILFSKKDHKDLLEVKEIEGIFMGKLSEAGMEKVKINLKRLHFVQPKPSFFGLFGKKRIEPRSVEVEHIFNLPDLLFI